MLLEQYRYAGPGAAHTQSYLFPPLLELLLQYGNGRDVFELGCGNGANAKRLVELGYQVTAVDPSSEGVKFAKSLGVDAEQGSTDDDLAARYGTFPIVVSLEVIEHVFSAHQYAQRVCDLLAPGGVAIISTPYHGYLKNLMLAVTGKLDNHFTALWDGGHIKFFSRKTLRSLFAQVGMEEIGFKRVGRIPPLAKSMICALRKPSLN